MNIAAETGPRLASANPIEPCATDAKRATPPLRILLVGNYKNDRQWSMLRFAQMLADGLSPVHTVRLIQPETFFGGAPIGEGLLRKWLGYFDKYILFPVALVRQSRWADVVHICDQGNAPYVRWLARKPHVATCHDTLAIFCAMGKFRDQRTRWTGRLYQRWILNGLRRAMRVVCVSPSTERDLLSLGGFQKERIAVVDNGLNYAYSPMDKSEAWQRIGKLGLDPGEDFFLHVGSNDWYKNRPGLLRIFSELRARSGKNFRLVLAGRPLTGELRTLAGDLGTRESIVEVDDVQSEDLRALYSAATALLVPSLQEGFGWPLIEAQACGCPVFASARGPLPYVGGDAAMYFDPDDSAGAAQIILDRLSRATEMGVAGVENARRFAAHAMIAGYVEQYGLAMSGYAVANAARTG